MSWRLMSNLKMISSDVKAKFPGTTIYSIGDPAHAARKSDHNPFDYGFGTVVAAIDIMMNVSTRSKMVAKALIGRSDLAYVIHNRTIWSAAYGWRARRYTGSDPHTNHIHVSAKHTSAADQTRKHIVWPGTAPVVSRPKVVVSPNAVLKVAPAFPAGAVFHPYLNSTPPVYETVRAFQKQMKARGWNIEPDGQFGANTKRVLVAFQKAHQRDEHLTVDGLLGIDSWRAAFTAPLG